MNKPIFDELLLPELMPAPNSPRFGFFKGECAERNLECGTRIFKGYFKRFVRAFINYLSSDKIHVNFMVFKMTVKSNKFPSSHRSVMSVFVCPGCFPA